MRSFKIKIIVFEVGNHLESYYPRLYAYGIRSFIFVNISIWFKKEFFFFSTLVLAVQKVLSGSGRAGRLRLVGKYHGKYILATTLLHDQNWTMPFRLIVLFGDPHTLIRFKDDLKVVWAHFRVFSRDVNKAHSAFWLVQSESHQ